MKRLTLLLLLLPIFACSETPQRDEPKTGAYIVSIDPPILDEGRPAEEEINLGELTDEGWQAVTITFSDIPKDLDVHHAYWRVSEWVLKGRVLTIRTFCDHRWYPGRRTFIVVSWDAGYKYLNYWCPDE